MCTTFSLWLRLQTNKIDETWRVANLTNKSFKSKWCNKTTIVLKTEKMNLQVAMFFFLQEDKDYFNYKFIFKVFIGRSMKFSA